MASEQALAVHMATQHGGKRVMRTRIQGSVCLCCMQEFGTRELVLAHLHEKSKRCFFYCTLLPPLAAEVVTGLDEAGKSNNAELRKQGWKPHKQLGKVRRLAGPLTKLAHDMGICHKYGLRGRCRLAAVKAAMHVEDPVV